jgi:HD-like signal output (HDOD) protein
MNEVSYSNINLLRVAQSFPAAPRIMLALGRLMRDPNSALGDVAVHLKHDSSLAARLLRIANSAAFAQSEPVASIEAATALIGLRDVHRLVGAVAVDHFSFRNYPLYAFTGPQLRDNALLVALLMEELAPPAGEEPATAYSAGLFRSIGKLALARIADDEAPAAPFRPEGSLRLADWEKQTFGRVSNEATAAILQEWHFPREVTQAIAEHYYPAAHSQPLAGLLNLAAQQAENLGHGLPGESAYWLNPAESARQSGLDPSAVQRAGERAMTALDRINHAVG